MNEISNPLGNIFISHRAIASIAHKAVSDTYGIVGLAPKNIAEDLANAIVKDPTLGVDVHYDGATVKIDLFIIVEYGTRITSVTNSAANNVTFQIHKTLGISQENIFVNIHVRGLRISDPD